MHNSSKHEHSAFTVIIADILLTAFFILTFAFFHHVLPSMRQKKLYNTSDNSSTIEAEPSALMNTSELSIESTPVPTPAPTPEPTPDTRTPWQVKFEDYFTDDVVITDNSYSSPNISINIDTVSTGEGSHAITYHVADIHIASIDCFKTYVSHGLYNYFDTQEITEMDSAVNSVLSISGDFCTYQKTGFLVRNGEICRNDEAWCDICALYEDGSMECMKHLEYTNDEVMSKGALQVWNFGPSLFDKDGNVRNDFYLYVSQTVMYPNPRSAMGFYEPGHYCFVVVDGRQEGYSAGMYLDELAQVFHDLGCKCAYNLDGGGSAVMTFNQERYSKQSNGADRALGDIVYICEPEGN